VNAPTDSLRAFWETGGWAAWALALLAGAAALTVLHQVCVCRLSRIAPPGLLADVLERVRAGELTAARQACEERDGALAAVALRMFDHLPQAPRAGVALLRGIAEAEGGRQAARLQSRVQWLPELATLAVLTGLAAALHGLWQVFGSVARDAALARPSAVAAGIAYAVSAMAASLAVAIPAAAAHAWLRRRVQQQIAALETGAAEILMALVARFER
jgi:biopolymer transport protein ExbB